VDDFRDSKSWVRHVTDNLQYGQIFQYYRTIIFLTRLICSLCYLLGIRVLLWSIYLFTLRFGLVYICCIFNAWRLFKFVYFISYALTSFKNVYIKLHGQSLIFITYNQLYSSVKVMKFKNKHRWCILFLRID
jgi:hypothetical protein